MIIGNRVKSRRIALGLTQTELARKMGFANRSTVSRVELNLDKNMTANKISKFAEALETNPAYLMGIIDDYSANPDYARITQRGENDGELLRIVSQLTDTNARLLKEFAKSLLKSQG